MTRLTNRKSNRLDNAWTNRVIGGVHGVDSLSASVTINGTTKTPSLRYKGGDANGTNWPAWGYGSTLTLESGTAPSYNQGPPTGSVAGWDSNTDGVLFNTGGYYLAPDTTTGNVSTDDPLWELVFAWSTTGTARCIDKRRVASPNEGWSFYENNNSQRVVGDDGADLGYNDTAALVDGTVYHMVAAINKNEASTNGGQLYIDGVASGSGVDYSAVGDLDYAVAMAIGARPGGANPFDKTMYYAAQWHHAGWFAAGAGGQAEIAAWALARSNAFWGV
ncbi:MAG: LamG domain-containing protein [Proteobacteria bacterium]|nr:LamG domain-containing protein [Pseudomonadota bacterium]